MGAGGFASLNKTMPMRWMKVHDCERPVRWRETFDEEQCNVYLKGLKAGSTLSRHAKEDAKGPMQTASRDSGYTNLVPNLKSLEEFLEANRRGAAHDKLVVVKVRRAGTRC